MWVAGWVRNWVFSWRFGELGGRGRGGLLGLLELLAALTFGFYGRKVPFLGLEKENKSVLGW